MSVAVGGAFVAMGDVELALLRTAGLEDSMALVDFGCGSGRLATALTRAQLAIDYVGIDIDQRLLDYAKDRTPAHFKFILNEALGIPCPDQSADFVCAFSVFTHLTHAESFIYLRDIARVLRPGGKLVFSFLEFADPNLWFVFEQTVAGESAGTAPHLNQFIERNAIDLWAEKLGYVREAFIDGTLPPCAGSAALGQACVILRRP
jgi:ubiquinone/menaquinone biosynthesis C-methylase UbiE